MNLFLTASGGLSTKTRQCVALIAEFLESCGYESLDKFGEICHNSIYLNSENFWESRLTQLSNLVKNADLIVIEASTPSHYTGMIIQMALDSSKQIICMHNHTSKSAFLTGITENSFKLAPYDPHDPVKAIKPLIKTMDSRKEIRFNMLLTSNLFSKLTQTAKEAGMSKSSFVRYLITNYLYEKSAQLKLS